jgi:MinD superfamily P-loop ATPase
MSSRIAFASGKGGTGKTTFAVNFAHFLSLSGYKVQVADLDVEEPNAHIFLNPAIESTHSVKVWIPSFDYGKCDFCGECAKVCQFNSLFVLPKEVLLFPELCKSCKLCKRVCEQHAVIDSEREVGVVREGVTGDRIYFVDGVLNVKEAMPVSVINEVKRALKEEYIQIIDAPPGTSCPFVKSVYDADIVVLVTEPTPFALHDLKSCVSFIKLLRKKIGVIVNRKIDDYLPLAEFLRSENIPVFAQIPEDLRIAKAYSEGKLFLESLPEYNRSFEELFHNIERTLNGKF